MKYEVAEEGKNGTVEITNTAVVRTVKKRIGKDDRQVIPVRNIIVVVQNRKLLGRDEVSVTTIAGEFVWKVKGDAEGFVNALNEVIR